MRVQRSFGAESEEGALYIVGTPIGHLQDLSPRAREILEQVDVIAAEDTRHTRKLLTRFDIAKKPLISYHEHNRKTRGPQLIERLLAGESVALVSDAGMPAIADPGEDLVREALERGLHVIPVPGPNAAITALVASGIPPVPFVFLGFLPRHPKEREEALSRWKEAEAALVCYEAPHRVISTLESVYRVLGDRRIAVARELTKTHEEWLRGTVGGSPCPSGGAPAPRGIYAGDRRCRSLRPKARSRVVVLPDRRGACRMVSPPRAIPQGGDPLRRPGPLPSEAGGVPDRSSRKQRGAIERPSLMEGPQVS